MDQSIILKKTWSTIVDQSLPFSLPSIPNSQPPHQLRPHLRPAWHPSDSSQPRTLPSPSCTLHRQERRRAPCPGCRRDGAVHLDTTTAAIRAMDQQTAGMRRWRRRPSSPTCSWCRSLRDPATTCCRASSSSAEVGRRSPLAPSSSSTADIIHPTLLLPALLPRPWSLPLIDVPAVVLLSGVTAPPCRRTEIRSSYNPPQVSSSLAPLLIAMAIVP